MNSKVSIVKLIYDTLIAILFCISLYGNILVETVPWYMIFGLTYWGFGVVMIYFIFICVFDWLALFNIVVDSKLEDFMRNVYLRLAMPFSIGASFIYWMLVLFEQITTGHSFLMFLGYVYMHGITCLLTFVDVFFGKHRFVGNYWSDCFIIFGFFLIYWGLFSFSKWGLGAEPYGFTRNMTITQLIGTAIVMGMIVMNSYGLYQLIAYHVFPGGKRPLIQNDVTINKEEKDNNKNNNSEKKDKLLNENDTTNNSNEV